MTQILIESQRKGPTFQVLRETQKRWQKYFNLLAMRQNSNSKSPSSSGGDMKFKKWELLSGSVGPAV